MAATPGEHGPGRNPRRTRTWPQPQENTDVATAVKYPHSAHTYEHSMTCVLWTSWKSSVAVYNG
jgi:hypothetical protein